MRVITYSSFEVLPSAYDLLFAQGARQSFCMTRPWFENLATNVLDPDERLRLIGVETDAPEPVALVLMVARHRDSDCSAGGARTLSSLGNYYSMVFAPLLTEGADPVRVLQLLVQAIGDQRPKYHALRFEPLDPASPLFGELRNALRDTGLLVQTYFHSGNWYERTAGTTSADYLARRPTALRDTIHREGDKLLTGGARLEIIEGRGDLERGIADYERVYARSWKPAEPYPQVIRNLLRACAADGALRLGLLHLGDEPIAAQIWIVWSGKATLYKLAHDRRFDRLSPGTFLTMRMIERVIDTDGVAEVDFGIGDDPYKGQWMSERRERWGLVAFDPRSLRGALGAVRHLGASKVKHLAAKCVSAGLRR